MRIWAIAVACVGAVVAACGAGAASSGAPIGGGGEDAGGSAVGDATTTPDGGGSAADATPEASSSDVDGDGIADADEDAWARDYFPFLSIHPDDGCKTHGVIARVSPHPKESGRVMIWFDVLYDEDCGASGHHGDNEMLGVVIDPKRPAPAGILAVRAISHQGTPCEKSTTCGSCDGMKACATATKGGKPYPVLFPSKDKHGGYVDKNTCSQSFVCDFGGCALAASAPQTSIVNVGEPTAPRVRDLTDQGFIKAENGWKSPALLHFDPWKKGDFGSAGDVSEDLVDPAFVIDTTRCAP